MVGRAIRCPCYEASGSPEFSVLRLIVKTGVDGCLQAGLLTDAEQIHPAPVPGHRRRDPPRGIVGAGDKVVPAKELVPGC
jgi:hypothetical protein